MLVPRTALVAALKCKADEATRYAMDGIHLERLDGRCFAVATDGRVMVATSWKADSEIPFKTTLSGPEIKEAIRLFGSGRKMIADGVIDEEAPIVAPKNDQGGAFRLSVGFNGSARSADIPAVDARFPNWRPIIEDYKTVEFPKEFKSHVRQIRVSAKQLKRALEAAVAASGNEESDAVDICIPLYGSQPVQIRPADQPRKSKESDPQHTVALLQPFGPVRGDADFKADVSVDAVLRRKEEKALANPPQEDKPKDTPVGPPVPKQDHNELEAIARRRLAGESWGTLAGELNLPVTTLRGRMKRWMAFINNQPLPERQTA